MRIRRGLNIRDVEVEVIAPEPRLPAIPASAEAAAEPAERAQQPSAVPQADPETTGHVHAPRVWAEPPSVEPTADLPRPAAIRQATTTRRPQSEVCEIAFWRGYVKGSFYARIYDDDGQPVAIAQSPLFRHRSKENPEATDQTVAAYESLRRQLERGGWEYASDGDTWFGTVFRRPE